MTEDDFAVVVRYLKGGKSPKEIGHLIGKSQWAVLKTIERFPKLRLIYLQTHTLRYPHKEEPSEKIETIRRLIVQ